jgi:hypothetical protein
MPTVSFLPNLELVNGIDEVQFKSSDVVIQKFRKTRLSTRFYPRTILTIINIYDGTILLQFTMNLAETDSRPAKKRRFFVEDASSPGASPATVPQSSSFASQPPTTEKIVSSPQDGFDISTLNAIIGEQLSEDVVLQLREASNGNLERGGYL